MVYFAYHTELDLRICNYAQKRCNCRENSKTRLTKSFVTMFALVERLLSSATLQGAMI